MRTLRGRFVDGVFEPTEPISLDAGEFERISYAERVLAIVARTNDEALASGADGAASSSKGAAREALIERRPAVWSALRLLGAARRPGGRG